jgi:hypothetical protein
MTDDLRTLKQRLLIPDVWQRLGLSNTPAASCRSPFRDDRSPSFSVYEGGRRWKDFASDEGGDVIDFIAHACQIDNREATRRFLAMAGASGEFIPPPSKSKATAKKLSLPKLSLGSDMEIATVAKIRGLMPEAISQARLLQTVAFGDVCGFPSWVLTDHARKIAEARRIDGKPYPRVQTLPERKAHTLKGSQKTWPAGAAVLGEIPNFRAIMLVEGGPDYLAAWHFIMKMEAYDVLPVAMLGRSVLKIDPEAVELFSGRKIRIYPHADDDGGGRTACERWAGQLHAAGCCVDTFGFDGLKRADGGSVKDLNDAALIDPKLTPELSNLIP